MMLFFTLLAAVVFVMAAPDVASGIAAAASASAANGTAANDIAHEPSQNGSSVLRDAQVAVPKATIEDQKPEGDDDPEVQNDPASNNTEQIRSIRRHRAIVSIVNDKLASEVIHWKAKLNHRFARLHHKERKHRLGAILRGKIPQHEVTYVLRGNEKIATILHNATIEPSRVVDANDSVPSFFDSRTQWWQCAGIIGYIRDQSACGSCWAVSTSSAMTDRNCITQALYNRISLSPTYSSNWAAADDVMTCSGGAPSGDACNGGFPSQAFAYMVKSGVMTGMNYTNLPSTWAGCKPYSIPPTGYASGTYSRTTCTSTRCLNADSNDQTRLWMSDSTYLYDGHSTYESQMMAEIAARGSIVAAFNFYEDLFHYSSGVYQYTAGAYVGGHAVRIIGWGTDYESGLPYWLIPNSFGTQWGDNGYVKFLRGSNNCGIEGEVSFGTVQVPYSDAIKAKQGNAQADDLKTKGAKCDS